MACVVGDNCVSAAEVLDCQRHGRGEYNSAEDADNEEERSHHTGNRLMVTIHVTATDARPEAHALYKEYDSTEDADDEEERSHYSRFSASASRSHLRSAAHGDLAVPRSRTTTYGQRSFSVSVRHCGTRCRSLSVTHL